MAEIIQLKNENGTQVYPVTTGEAITMAGGKTLDQAFSDKANEIKEEISGTTFYDQGSEMNNLATFNVGAIMLAVCYRPNMMGTNPINSDVELYWYGASTVEATLAERYLKYYGQDSASQYSKVSGTWKTRGGFKIDDNTMFIIVQKVAV